MRCNQDDLCRLRSAFVVVDDVMMTKSNKYQQEENGRRVVRCQGKEEAPKEEKADLSELSKELEKLKSQLSELKKNSN